jgi:MFS family permease
VKTYAAVLREPHVALLLCAAVITRLPVGINALALVLYLRELTGSFAIAGAVTGALGLGSGIGAPLRGRLVDRLGQRRVLLSSAAFHALSLGAVVLAGELGAPWPVLALFAATAGFFTPPSSAVLRSLWPTLLGRRPDLLTAGYALDTVLIEIVFIGGPLIAAGLAAVASPAAALVVSAVSVIGGTLLFVSTPPSRAARVSEDAGSQGRLGALRSPGLRTLVISTIPIGICFGAMEVILPAFADEKGSATAAGVLLAVWSAGSALGGLFYGTYTRTLALSEVHLRLALALPLGYLPLAFAPSVGVMLLLVVPAGLTIAPLLASRNELVGRVAPPGAETEAFTWPVTALLAGIAVGSALAGIVVEEAGWQAAILAATACAAMGSVLAYTRRATLAGAPPGSPKGVIR